MHQFTDYSFVHLFARSFIHLFVCSFVHAFIHSFNHLFIHSLVHWFTQTCSFFMSLVACHLLGISKTISSFAHAPRSHKHSYRPLPTTARHYLVSIISAFHGVWASIPWFNIHWASTCVNIYFLNVHIMFIPHELLIPRTWELGNCSSFNIPNIPQKNPCASMCRATSLLGACAATRCSEQDTVVVIKCCQWVSISVANCKSMIC